MNRLLPLLLIFSISGYLSAREIKVYNKCPFTTWAGILGKPEIPAGGGFRLNAGETKSVFMNDGWEGRFWPRTECDGNMNCATGSCGPREQCNGAGGEPPASLAEFKLRGDAGLDFYDVSLVDGYNIPPAKELAVASKTSMIFAQEILLSEEVSLRFRDILVFQLSDGRTVACKSGCLAYNTDQECCRGAFDTRKKCRPSETAKLFKKACPSAYSYAFDDPTSLFTCKDATYVVQFC
ncbi:hypothetical protein CRE_16853 [Caenorhabditis remanei]|uniref:Uncharacterized protein n=1 Tax=Caenorhabditis remanei TaxID=31234 RepID=E3MSC3_CAERE|nr:hypothetical protein CRE_16853 [Caenorhabditis remanei]